MFDWNDEELANIIWGEAADSDDHIVPYSEANENYYDKKEWNQDKVYTKSPRTDADDTHGRKRESRSVNEEGISTSNLSTDSSVDLSMSRPYRINQDIKDIKKIQSTEEVKEQADFVDYGWANIGSFDDLDTIFSNDEPIFGEVSLSDPDELWSSSSTKDVPSSALKLFPAVESRDLELGVETGERKNPEYSRQNEHLSTLSNGRNSDAGLLGLQSGSAILANVVKDATGAIANDKTDLKKMGKPAAASLHQSTDDNMAANEYSNKKKRSKYCNRAEGKCEEKMFQDFRGNWPSSTNSADQFDNSLGLQLGTPSTSVITKSSQIRGVEPLRYQQTSNPSAHQPFYAIAANAYPAMPLLSQLQPFINHDISPGGINRVDKPAHGYVKSLTMTPQEKIKKLRRRQQMQAIIAIKKQQQQFKNQASTVSQSKPIVKTDLDSEEICILPALDSLEQDDSNAVSPAVDHSSMEEVVLSRLQEIISKLDFEIRLCIRDSLFRLAQSAAQRHNANDTSSSNKCTRDEHVISTKVEINSHCRISGMPDAETETNPIDRTVAHLLFHRPLELLQNYPDAPESPIFTKLSYEQKEDLKSMPMESLPENKSGKRHVSMDEHKCSWIAAETQQIQTSYCMDTLDNVSYTGLVDDAVLEYEASQ